jgi:putative FmdB family regulatory protein
VPTYDYQCRTCGHTIEVIHSMTEDGPTTCEVCGGPLRRIFHPTGIIFKGSGFYKTDSRSSSSASVRAGSSKPATPPADGGTSSGPASDSAPKSGDSKPTTGSGSPSANSGG